MSEVRGERQFELDGLRNRITISQDDFGGYNTSAERQHSDTLRNEVTRFIRRHGNPRYNPDRTATERQYIDMLGGGGKGILQFATPDKTNATEVLTEDLLRKAMGDIYNAKPRKPMFDARMFPTPLTSERLR